MHKLCIGINEKDEEIYIPYKSRESHLHVIGRTRSGKSRFLADLIIQDILNSQGLCVIDPHDELVGYVLSWLTRNKLVSRRKRIHPVSFDDPNHTFCFNPLQINHPDEAYSAADLVTESLSKVYGNTATDTPLIGATLNTIFVILAERGLPLAAAQYFVKDHVSDVRDKIVTGHPDPYYRSLGEEFSRMSAKEFRETMASTERRLRQFIGRPIMRRFFSQTENTIDWRSAMDNGDVLLFNLKPNKLVDPSQMRALGMMLTGTVVDVAFSRDERIKQRPFFLYLDEIQNLVSDDIDRILSECSKFGLFVTASHQYLQQLRDEGERIHSAIMANTLLKALFSISHQDAMAFVDDAFSDQIDPERVKENVKSPHVVGHRRARFANFGLSVGSGQSKTTTHTVGSSHGATDGTSTTRQRGGSSTYTHGRSTGSSSSSGSAYGGTYGSSESDGATWERGEYFDRTFNESSGSSSSSSETHHSSSSTHTSESWSEAQGSSWSDSNTASKSHTHTDSRSTASGIGVSTNFNLTAGFSEGLEPIIEWFSTQTWSLEEQRYVFARQISRSPKRQGHFVAIGHGTIPFKTRDRPDLPHLEIGETAFKDRLKSTSAWFIRSKAAKENAKRMRETLGETDAERDEDPGDMFG